MAAPPLSTPPWMMLGGLAGPRRVMDDDQNADDDDSEPALIRAVKQDKVEHAISLLNEGTDPDVTDKTGETALAIVVRFICTGLMFLGYARTDASQTESTTRVNAARVDQTQRDRVDLVRALLKAKANPHVRDNCGMPVLAYTIVSGRRDIEQLLRDAGASE